MKFIAAALALSLPLVTATEDTNGKQKFLRDRNLKEGVDPALNKFVVDPNPSPNLFADGGVAEIVAGTVVDPPRKYGFFVSIGGCGASLVAPNVILSAAHCAAITGPAVLGLHKKTVDGAEEFENIEIIPFANNITHPQYNGLTYDNDYWVIQLAHDSQLYQDQIVELDSPNDNFELTAGQDVTVIGMGKLASGGSSPNTLQEVTVDYITNAACCTGDYQYSCTQLTANMMCAARAGQDSCQGDSGGPIFDTATQKQVGIVSWGYGCADASYPGVYSRVSAKYDWIKAQIDTFNSEGTNPPAPKMPGTCYNSPEFWYDSYGFDCTWYDSHLDSCSDSSYANGGITSNMACCVCGGGEGGTTTTTVPPPPSSPTTVLEKCESLVDCETETSFGRLMSCVAKAIKSKDACEDAIAASNGKGIGPILSDESMFWQDKNPSGHVRRRQQEATSSCGSAALSLCNNTCPDTDSDVEERSMWFACLDQVIYDDAYNNTEFDVADCEGELTDEDAWNFVAVACGWEADGLFN